MPKIAIAAVTDTNFYIEQEHQQYTEFIPFRISPDRLSETEMPDSAFASPARYVAEMAYRLHLQIVGPTGLLVLNPRLSQDNHFLLNKVCYITYQLIKENPALPAALFLDGNKIPIAYYINLESWSQQNWFLLTFLTCLDGDRDAQFLQLLYGQCQALHITKDQHNILWYNGFLQGYVQPETQNYLIDHIMAILAEMEPDKRQEYLRHAKFCALVGFHAGDILFFLQAQRNFPNDFSEILICQDFADIVEHSGKDIRPLAIDYPPFGRKGSPDINEHEYLIQLLRLGKQQHIEPQALPLIFRPYRDYCNSILHLREAYRFAMGDHFLNPIPNFGMDRIKFKAKKPSSGSKKIGLHFDGGWDLKRFPPMYRSELCEMLVDKGFDLYIIGNQEPNLPASVQFFPYRNLNIYKELLVTTDLFIGIDSFPAHFSVEYGIPTLHLFGSTAPRNSRYPESEKYRFLHQAMSCCPCRMPTTCNQSQMNYCMAFANPHTIVKAALELLG